MVNIINNLFSLKGKTIILVGSTGYLGTSIAKAISDAEGEMILVGRSAKRLKSQIDALPNSKKLTCHLFELDITDDNAEIRLRQFLEENFGKLHGIVNNAALNPKVEESFQETGFESFCVNKWKQEISVGLTGAILVTKIIAPIMLNKSYLPSIVNISSDE